jgi:hypothetical protein
MPNVPNPFGTTQAGKDLAAKHDTMTTGHSKTAESQTTGTRKVLPGVSGDRTECHALMEEARKRNDEIMQYKFLSPLIRQAETFSQSLESRLYAKPVEELRKIIKTTEPLQKRGFIKRMTQTQRNARKELTRTDGPLDRYIQSQFMAYMKSLIEAKRLELPTEDHAKFNLEVEYYMKSNEGYRLEPDTRSCTYTWLAPGEQLEYVPDFGGARSKGVRKTQKKRNSHKRR